MSISALREFCHENNISTSASLTRADNFCPKERDTVGLTIRVWENNTYSEKANQKGSFVFDPYTWETIFPNETQLQKVDQPFRECVLKIENCVKENKEDCISKIKNYEEEKKEGFPITKEWVVLMLGNTVVKPKLQAV